MSLIRQIKCAYVISLEGMWFFKSQVYCCFRD